MIHHLLQAEHVYHSSVPVGDSYLSCDFFWPDFVSVVVFVVELVPNPSCCAFLKFVVHISLSNSSFVPS